jgi:subtilisin family serine protease
MTGRPLLLVLTMAFALTASAQPASVPLIIEKSPTASITAITASLGATVVDSIPGADTYLLNVPAVPSPATASLLGIQWLELNTGVTLPGFVQLGVLPIPANAAPDWYKYQPSMQLIRAGAALTYSRGQGVVVADINSQIDYGHPALVGHLAGGYDFVTNRPAGSTALNQSSASFLDQSSASFLDQSSASFLDQSSASFLDQSSASFLDGLNPAYSHGTLCAGVIAVVAPDSAIMPLRAFDEYGRSDLFTLAKAIRYGVQHGAHVINMSFGTLTPSTALSKAIDYARTSGVTLTASAGNNNTSAPQYPAAFNGVITVAATDLLDAKASFSNYGSFVFVTAPGVNIVSAFPDDYYSVVSGTSFSAPAVAGTAALLRSLGTSAVAAPISGAAVNIDAQNPGYQGQLGHGRIDVLGAVD